MSLKEVRQAADEIRSTADPRANVIFGATFGDVPDGEVHVTLIATGLDGRRRHETAIRHEPERRPEPLTLPFPDARPAAPAAAAAPPAPAAPARAEAEEPLDLPTFLRNPRPTSGTGRRREPRRAPTPTGPRPG
jgi:cell division protein FtsZ